MAIFIKFVSEEDPLRANYSEKEWTRKICPFIVTNNWLVSAVRWSVKYLLAPNSALFWKSGGEIKKKKDS